MDYVRAPLLPSCKFSLSRDPTASSGLRAGVVLHDSLAPLAHRVLRELPGQDEAHRGLDLPRSHCRALPQATKTIRFSRDALEGVPDARLHDLHGLLRDAQLGVHPM